MICKTNKDLIRLNNYNQKTISHLNKKVSCLELKNKNLEKSLSSSNNLVESLKKEAKSNEEKIAKLENQLKKSTDYLETFKRNNYKDEYEETKKWTLKAAQDFSMDNLVVFFKY